MQTEKDSRRLIGAAWAILVAGIAAGVVIFLTAQPDAPNPLGYDPKNTKEYVREMELYGGQANIFAAEITDWFRGLWHGKELAFTVAALALIVAWVLWFFGTHPPPEEAEDGKRVQR
ncbi:MAG: hypothetical protein ACREFX_02045 [Opitutaceae bacterium]